MGQALQRVKAAVVESMAIGPFVVAGHVDHRTAHAGKHRQRVGVDVVGAFGTAVLDVAVVDREGDVGAVDAGQHGRQFLVVASLLVGHVTPQAERVGAGIVVAGMHRGVALAQCGAAGQGGQHQRCGEGGKAQSGHVSFLRRQSGPR